MDGLLNFFDLVYLNFLSFKQSSVICMQYVLILWWGLIFNRLYRSWSGQVVQVMKTSVFFDRVTQSFLQHVATVNIWHAIRKLSNSFVVTGALWDSEQTLQSGSEEHWPGDESRDNGRRRAGKDAEQLPRGWFCSVTAGWCGGETQCPEEEGEEHISQNKQTKQILPNSWHVS